LEQSHRAGWIWRCYRREAVGQAMAGGLRPSGGPPVGLGKGRAVTTRGARPAEPERFGSSECPCLHD